MKIKAKTGRARLMASLPSIITRHWKASRLGFLILLMAAYFLYNRYHSPLLVAGENDPNEVRQPDVVVPPRKTSLAAVIPKCTKEQLDVILYQLPPDECMNTKRPYLQRCSFTYATQCPQPVWLEEHYTKIHASIDDYSTSPLIAIYVGCNKGMDAINALRMLSGNATFDKNRWRESMMERSSDKKWVEGVCNQEYAQQFNIPKKRKKQGRPAHVHCIEPMPVTFEALQRSAKELRWEDHLATVHGAMSIKDGISHVPSSNKSGLGVGVENLGMDSWTSMCTETGGKESISCDTLVTYRLDTYVEKFVKRHDGTEPSIQYLSVDVEGFDFDVLLGGPAMLERVQYLEFEYNWMGSWKTQNLSDAIHMLEQKGFICYWPGMGGNIWRISGCWLDHYGSRFWSNVACVNQNFREVASMANRMEELFMATVAKGHAIRYDDTAKPQKIKAKSK